MSKILGIDLGTTNSAFAVIEDGEPKILENAEGNRTTPSIVAISKKGDRLVGQVAKRQAVTNPHNTIFGIKRFIGHKFSDEPVQRDKEIVPYDIREGKNGAIEVQMNDKWYTPEELSAIILQKIKADAEAKTGEKITEAVITVPAYFNDSQRQATKDAGKIAGLEVKRIINEPTAAALAYGLDRKKDEKIVVFDLGGGTYDISVLEVGDDVVEVKSVDGDSHLGGKDFDQKIIGWIISEFKKDQGIDLSKDPLALQRLDEAAEKAKIELSSAEQTEINIPFVTSGDEGPIHLVMTLTRAKLEELVQEYIDKALQITKRAVENSPFSLGEIDEIILVGGQTRMPAIIEAVNKLFGKEPNKTINPDEVVARGAAVQAGIFQGDVKDVLLLDVIPLSLGIETMGNVATKLIEKNTTIPTSKSQTFSTAADNQTSVEIHIVQGERAMAADNKSLGRFILDGIPPAPRGMPQIEVSFDVDSDGILNVKAIDKATNKEQSIRIEASSGLSDEEIEKMKQEAERNAASDEEKKKLVQTKNSAEQLAYTAEKALKDNGDNVSDETKSLVEAKIKEVRQTIAGDDAAKIEEVSKNLSEAMQKIGEEVAAAQSGSDEKTTDQSSDESVIDAEVEEDTAHNSSEGQSDEEGDENK